MSRPARKSPIRLEAVPGQREITLALAEHFLDTETRHLLPATAWTCLHHRQSGAWSLDWIETLWWRGLVPALGPNLLAVAGEWAAWNDEDVERRVQLALDEATWKHWLREWFPVPGRRAFREWWSSLEACYRYLEGRPAPGETAERLVELARICLDLPVDEGPGSGFEEHCPVPIMSLLAPVLSPGEQAAGWERLRSLGRDPRGETS